MRIAILGRTEILYDTAKLLEKSGHEIVLIGTCKEAPEYSVTEKDFRELAEDMSVPFFQSANINSVEIIQLIKSVKPDIGISINWLTMIKEEVISLFPHGILNAHCGDLPRYRGNACPNWAIINGEKQIGITIHCMDPMLLDGGDIILKDFYPVHETTTITAVYDYMQHKIPELFLRAVDQIKEGTVLPKQQSVKRADILRTYPRIPSDSLIDWRLSNVVIDRLIRASCDPFQGAYTYYGEKKITILEADIGEHEFPCHVIPGQVVYIDKQKEEATVAAGQGTIIIKKIRVENKDSKITEIFNSTRIRLGYVMEDKIYELEKRIKILEKG